MGSLTARGPAMPRDIGTSGVAFRRPPRRRHPEVPKAHTSGHVFRGSIPSPHAPLPTLRPPPLRTAAHGSEPVRFATSSLLDFFIPFNLPVLTGATEDTCPGCTTTFWNGNDCVPAPWVRTWKRLRRRSTEKGYPPATVALKVRQAAKFGHWLGRQGFTVDEVDEQAVARFIQLHPCAPRRGDGATLRDVLEQVRSAGLAPPAPAKVDDTAIGRIVSEFRAGICWWTVACPSRLGSTTCPCPLVPRGAVRWQEGTPQCTRAPGCG